MKTYIGCKMVSAEPHSKEGKDGYKVVYRDGYVSWSPKEVFEKSYRETSGDTIELVDTLLLMQSADYKERFEAEYYQTVIRYKKLQSMLDKWDKGELKFNPTCPRSTYNIQIRAMTDYLSVLEARAVMEGIDLKEVDFNENMD